MNEWSVDKDREEEKLKEEIIKKQQQTKEQWKEKIEKQQLYKNKLRIILKLEKLRQSRRQIKREQGYEVEEIVTMNERIRSLYSDYLFAKESKQKEQSRFQEQQPDLSENNNNNNNNNEKKKKKEINEEEEAVKEFYDQAHKTLDNLITIRRGWDMFLVTNTNNRMMGGSSRIPQYWPSEYPLSINNDDLWKSLIVNM